MKEFLRQNGSSGCFSIIYSAVINSLSYCSEKLTFQIGTKKHFTALEIIKIQATHCPCFSSKILKNAPVSYHVSKVYYDF